MQYLFASDYFNLMAADQGIDPRLSASKADLLPLQQSAIYGVKDNTKLLAQC